MKELAKSKGGKCLSKKYLNARSPLKWKCADGHKWDASPSNILGNKSKKGTWCPKCKGKSISKSKFKYDISYVERIGKNLGYKLLSKTYKGLHENYLWQCKKCKHQWKSTPKNMKKGSSCPRCSGRANNLEDLKSKAKQNKGKLLCTEFKGMRVKYRWRCKNDHEWNASGTAVFTRGSWCGICRKQEAGKVRRKPFRSLQAEAKKVQLIPQFKASEYKGSDIFHKYKCKSCRKIISQKPNRILAGAGCPRCSSGLYERICRVVLEEMFQENFPKKRPKWLKNERNNQMELDGFSEKLGIAFEHQGRHHYEVSHFTQSKEKLKIRKKDDLLKKKLCKQRNIILIPIPELNYDLSYKDLPKFIKDYVSKHGIKPKKWKNINLESAYLLENKLKKYQSEIKRRKIKVLANSWLGNGYKYMHRCLRCKSEWKTTPGHVKLGTGCPKCAIENRAKKQRASIEDAKDLAIKKGGRCLSRKYINSSTDLKWLCNTCNYKWLAPYGRVKSSTWCPNCAGQVKPDIKEFIKTAQLNKGICLSKKYVNAKTKLEFKCKNNHYFEKSGTDIRTGKWCPTCAKQEKWKNQRIDVLPLIKKRGGKYHGPLRKNNRIYHKVECKEGHKWEVATCNLTKGKWCKKCASQARKKASN